MSVLYFVHIPKTAGTSFRTSASRCLGSAHVFYDYGVDSSETSGEVKRSVYERDDIWLLHHLANSKKIRFFSGHKPVVKYVPLFGVDGTATFVRDPVQRLVSDHAHFVRHHGYSGTFEAFYNRSTMTNRQHKLLNGVPLEAYGFIGITERYRESIELFNHLYGVKFEYLEANTAGKKPLATRELDPKDVAEIERLNAKDMALYDKACWLFEQRLSAWREGWRYAHTELTDVKQDKVSGWAWYEGGSDEPVTVSVRINGTIVAQCQAVNFRLASCRYKAPRGGFVGFSAPVTLSEGDRVDCEVQGTGQVFPREPLPFGL
ncbi:sulfotransferase family 2 domain-containing protein [Marinimicrobium sp. ARAG 43.8]|uniref:sulfotransferase family 2 domain-containing protein n=1 Tax=Marinimicrobium sp. ARAG 43.8 TaxID=3418719 RepID=UPI003CF49488